jgi:uncharacterized protein YigE (DUF2233 family)
MLGNAGHTALLLFATLARLAAGPVTEESVTHAGVKFRVVRVEPQRVELAWKDAKGIPFRTFDKLHSALAAQGRTPRLLMNAGLFQSGGTPCGLYIERGTTLTPLNLNDGYGNFHLKPNGVCWIETNGTTRHAVVASSATYRARAATLKAAAKQPRIDTAIQSGPLLLDAGRRHPAFRAGSPNKLHRNGVGVDAKGLLVFAITADGQVVNFWDFSGLFLALGCQHALFLDGNLSQMLANPTRPTSSNAFGAIFVVAD